MSNRTVNIIVVVLSIVVAGLVSILAKVSFPGAEDLPWDVKMQPKLHAALNSITACLIIVGFIAIKLKQVTIHRFCMFGAVIASALFLVSYVIYHALTESTKFGGEGSLKMLYFFILVSHIILAAIIFPMVLITMHRAVTNQLVAHKTWAKITFPIWLYVAITGVVVYLMLAPYY